MAMTSDRALRRLRHLDDMPYGAARSRAALELVDSIREEGPADCLAYALVQLIDTYYFGGQADRAFVPFTELVGWLDRSPEQFDKSDIHNACWAFKILVSALPAFPSISREQVEQALDDLERHFRQAGFEPDVPAQRRFEWADHLGAPDADSRLAEWRTTPRGELSNCELCGPIDTAGYLARAGRRDEAIDQLEHVFATVDVGAFPHCLRQPFGGYVLLSHLYLDRAQPGDEVQAVDMHWRALGHIAEPHVTAEALGRCLEFAARARQADHVFRLLQAHGARGLRADLPLQRMLFLAGLAATTGLLDEELGLGDRHVTIAGAGADTVAGLAQWARSQALEWAGQFDARNGTTTWSERIGQAVKGRSWSEPLNLEAVSRAIAAAASDEGAPVVVVDPGDAPDPAKPRALSPAQLVERAESAPAGTSPAARATWYLTAARGFEEVGALREAAFAWAEAGVLARLVDDLPGAASALGRATQILRHLADVPVEVQAPVRREFAQAAAEIGNREQALETLDQLDADLGDLPTDEAGTAELRAAADLARARVLTILGQPRAAADLADSTAQRAASQDNLATAVQAFLIAATALVAAGDDEAALWHFESACEGANLLREPALRAHMIDQYVAALRRLGRSAEADALLERW
jgi:hypothetical protein